MKFVSARINIEFGGGREEEEDEEDEEDEGYEEPGWESRKTKINFQGCG